MLQSIRDRAQNWIFLVIIGLLVLAFAFWGAERFFEGHAASKVVAKVEGHKITKNEYDAVYQRLRRQLQLQMGAQFNLTPNVEKNLRKQALNQIITNYVLTTAAQEKGFRITSGQIDSVLANTQAFQENGQFSASRFQAVLSNLFYPEPAFLNQLRSDLLINQMQMGFAATAFATPSEVSNAYKLLNQKRDISYVIIPAARFKKQIKISTEAAKAYYQQNLVKFKTPEQVKIAYVQLNLKAIIAKQNITQTEVKNYYESNKDNYMTPKRWHVAQILVRIPANASKAVEAKTKARLAEIEKALQSGEDFSKVAKTYSEDIVSRDKGGVLPWFTAGMIDPAFVKASNELKVGQVSKPIRTKFGYNIIKLLAIKQQKQLAFDKVKAQIKKSLAEQKANKIFANESDQLSNLTFSDSSSLNSAAKALHLSIKTTDYFSKKGEKKGLLANPKIVNAAFSNTVLVQNYNSDPIQVSDSNIIVLRVKDHKAANTKSFASVKEAIVKTLTSEQAKTDAKDFGTKLIASLTQGKSLNKVASQNSLQLKNEKNAGRHDKKVNMNILNEAFKTPLPENKKASFSSVSLNNGDFAIVEVSKVMNGDVNNMTAAEKDAFKNQLAKSFGQMDWALFIKQKMDAADIKKL